MGRPQSPNKREFISAKILPELIQALERLAEEDGRSRSNVLERALQGWFLANRPDLLAPPNPEEVNAEFRKALGIDEKR